MSKETSAIILGILIMVMPFLGFPQSFRTVFFVVAGVAIAGIGFSLRTKTLSLHDTQKGEIYKQSDVRRDDIRSYDRSIEPTQQ